MEAGCSSLQTLARHGSRCWWRFEWKASSQKPCGDGRHHGSNLSDFSAKSNLCFTGSCLAAKVPEKTAAQLLSLTHPHSWSLATWHQQSQAGPLQMEVDVSLWQTSTGILWWDFYQSHIGIHSSSDILLHWWCSRMEESWKRLASQTFEMGGGQAFPCRVCTQKTSRSHCGDTAVGSAVAACKEKCATPVDNNFQREGQRESSLEVSLAWTVASSERRPCVRQPRQVMQTKPTRKKKKEKKGVEWATHANTLKKTVNLKEKRHLRRAYQSFCASWQLNCKCYTLETLGFYTFPPKILLMLILQIANITAPLRALWPCFWHSEWFWVSNLFLPVVLSGITWFQLPPRLARHTTKKSAPWFQQTTPVWTSSTPGEAWPQNAAEIMQTPKK